MISLHMEAGNEVEIDGRKVISNYDMLRISVITKRLNPTVNHGHVKTQMVQEEKFIENEKCPVFCLQVPSEVFYVRRNGKTCWTANSRAMGHVTTKVIGRNRWLPVWLSKIPCRINSVTYLLSYITI